MVSVRGAISRSVLLILSGIVVLFLVSRMTVAENTNEQHGKLTALMYSVAQSSTIYVIEQECPIWAAVELSWHSEIVTSV